MAWSGRRISLGLALIPALVLSGQPSVAEACGGFVFDEIDSEAAMAGQQIFVGFGDSATHLVVSATYAKASLSAAFLLPLAAPPQDVVDGDEDLFEALNRGTAPRFQIEEEQPEPRAMGCGDNSVAAGGDSFGDGGGEGDDQVDIYDTGMTATYEYAVVGGSTGQSIAEWLEAEGFVLSDEMATVMQPYVDQGWVFLAAKLTPGANRESLAPLQLELPAAPPETFSIPFAFGAPSVPAGTPLELLLYVVAGGETSPANYAFDEVDPDRLRAVSESESNYRELFDEQVSADADGVFMKEWVGGDWAPYDLSDWYSDWWYGETGGSDTQVWLNGVALSGTLTRMRTRLSADQLRDLRFSFAASRELSYRQTLTYGDERRGCRVGDRVGGGGLALLGMLGLLSFRRRRRG